MYNEYYSYTNYFIILFCKSINHKRGAKELHKEHKVLYYSYIPLGSFEPALCTLWLKIVGI